MGFRGIHVASKPAVPRSGVEPLDGKRQQEQDCDVDADFDLQGVCDALEAMRLPDPDCFDGRPRRLRMRSPGGLGVVLRSPDGGHWLQARPLAPEEQFTPDAPGSAGAGSPSLINLSSS